MLPSPTTLSLPKAAHPLLDTSSLSLSTNSRALSSGCPAGSATTYTVPQGATSITAADGYANCNHLRDITFPNTLIHIGDDAFSNQDEGLNALTSIALNARLQTIGTKAFFEVPLGAIDLPPSLISIGDVRSSPAQA